MSRIGKAPITVPEGVKATLDHALLTIEGPKGKLTLQVHPAASVAIDEGARRILVTLHDTSPLNARETRKHRAAWGTVQRLITNMIKGVSTEYTKEFQVVGVGYGARLEGGSIILRCGYANEVKVPVPEGVIVAPPEPGNLLISGIGAVPCTTVRCKSIDKRLVGQFAAAVRRIRPPEPYKGKGIRYVNEEVKRKAGKALAAGAK